MLSKCEPVVQFIIVYLFDRKRPCYLTKVVAIDYPTKIDSVFSQLVELQTNSLHYQDIFVNNYQHHV